jgi:riboflavin-specific deaminase-like protein
MCGSTIDGKITIRQGTSSKIFGKILKKEKGFKEMTEKLYQKRAQSDGIMVGSKTIIIDNPSLRAKNKDLVRVIPDAKGEIPLNSNIFIDGGKTIIGITKRTPKSYIRELKKKCIKIVLCGSGPNIDLSLLMKKLYLIGIRKLMVEGGGTLNWNLISKGLVDEIIVVTFPLLVGGLKTPTICDGDGIEDINEIIFAKLIRVYRTDSFVLKRYKLNQK